MNKMKFTAGMIVLAGLLIAPNVLASEVAKEGTQIKVTEHEKYDLNFNGTIVKQAEVKPQTPATQEELPSASAEVKSQDKKVLPKTGSKEDGILVNIAFGIIFVLACIKAYFSKKG